MKYRLGILVHCVILLVCLAGCNIGQESGDAVNDSQNPFTPEALMRCWTAFDQSESPGFQKPDCASVGPRIFFTTEEWGRYGEGRDGNIQGVVGRPHMHSTAYVRESWLNPGEPFVIDGAHMVYGNVPTDFTVIALVESERVPFKLIRVDQPDGFPSIEDIMALQPSDFDISASMPMGKNEPYNFTLIVPPESFPNEGRHNLRVLFVPQFEPSSERAAIRQRIPFHRTHTVYYGSEEAVNGNPWGEPRPAVSTEWSQNERELIQGLEGMFLAPPEHLYDMSQADHPQDLRLAQEFRTYAERVTLYLNAGGISTRDTDTTGQNLYLILRDSTVVDSFLGTPHDLSGYDGTEFTQGSQPGTTAFPIDVEVSSDASFYTALVFPFPLQPQTPGLEVEPKASNFIMLRRSTAN